MITNFYVYWTYGEHGKWLEVSEKDIQSVKDSMSTEFEIFSKEKPIEFSNGKSVKVTEYSIENYYGDRYVFACKEEIEVKSD